MSAEDVRAELAEVLAAHASASRVAEPRNNADRNLGRTRYEMRCTCGSLLPWDGGDGKEHHRNHVATLLAEYVATKQAEAWVVGRGDGYNEALFDEKGSHSDPDAHTFPRRNPYWIAP